MFRVMKHCGKSFAVECDIYSEEEQDNILQLVEEGNTIILTNDLEDAKELLSDDLLGDYEIVLIDKLQEG